MTMIANASMSKVSGFMKKSCMNCISRMPACEGETRKGQGCQKNPDMRVNGRMVCEEWKSADS